MNVNKNEAKRLDDLTTRMRKKLATAVAVHTNPVEIGTKDLANMLYYLDMLREELDYRVDHYVSDPKKSVWEQSKLFD